MDWTYERFVCLYLNAEYARAAGVTDAADAHAVGSGAATTPRAWIDLLTDDPAERSEWRLREFRRGL